MNKKSVQVNHVTDEYMHHQAAVLAQISIAKC